MVKHFCFLLMVFGILGLSLPTFSQEVKVYEVHRVSGAAPTIDGEYTEEEWAGSEWTSGFYGLRHSANAPAYQGQPVDINWRWRALWDDEYLYVLFNADLTYINANGWTWTGTTDYLAADDTGYAGWGVGSNLDFEFFLTPNWDEEETILLNEPANNPPDINWLIFPCYRMRTLIQQFWCADSAEGPPFFHTGNIGAAPYIIAGDWAPIYDETEAEAAECSHYA